MMTPYAGFTVLSTPVALCDRRALSQAWYSALHVHNTAGAAVSPRRKTPAQSVMQHRSRAQAPAGGASRGFGNAASRAGATLAITGAPATERRIVRSKLAQQIERTFSGPKLPPKHASFLLEGSRGRVQILLQQHGSHTQIVALCPPAARGLVAQALAQARYALSLRGISIQSDVRGFVRS